MTTGMVALFAVSCGISVASLYYAQPLLPAIARTFHLRSGTAALVVTAAQVGYCAGLALIVPLGDVLVRRRLVPALLAVAAAALFAAAASPSAVVLIGAVAVAGLCSVSAQILVPFAAHLADDRNRGRVIGTVMSGLLLGILLARTFSGAIAELGGWRSVYVVAGGVVTVLTVVLVVVLPGEDPRPHPRYGELLASVVRLLRTEPLLRFRSALGALIFAAFNVIWTSLAFLLVRPPYGYSEAVIGLFGLLGAGGSLAAVFSGRLADRGYERLVTGGSLVLLLASFGLLAMGAEQLWALMLGILVGDLAIAAVHIQNQQLIFGIDPEARSRLNTGYMVSYFVGGAVGSATTGAAYAADGWSAVVVLGVVYSAAALVVWLTSRLGGARARPPTMP
jgi:predicted MFS family arabinose efflux permease